MALHPQPADGGRHFDASRPRQPPVELPRCEHLEPPRVHLPRHGGAASCRRIRARQAVGVDFLRQSLSPWM